MNRRNTLIILIALAAGIGIGLTVHSIIDRSEPITTAAQPAAKPGTAITRSQTPATAINTDTAPPLTVLSVQPSVGSATSPTEDAPPAQSESAHATAAGMPEFNRLEAQLLTERNARERLQDEVDRLKTTLSSVAKQLTALAEQNEQARNRRLAAGGGADPAALVAAGFNAADAVTLAERWGEQQMDRLYLRDQAIREGWIDTPRYTEELQALSGSSESLRSELGDDGYDRFLHAIGQPNRVEVSSVIESSPGQIAGLQAGDMILNYAGTPIRTSGDLRDAITGGSPDEPVALQVVRDGQPLEFVLPRGPIGIMMDAVSVAPN